jgi:ribonuclease BN (tRNA processing enzyme)
MNALRRILVLGIIVVPQQRRVRKFLFDAGRGAMQRLAQLKVRWQDVAGVFLTHLHSDHVVGDLL